MSARELWEELDATDEQMRKHFGRS
jgi:hypothetical protein